MWQTITFPFNDSQSYEVAKKAAAAWRKIADKNNEVHEICVNNAISFEYRKMKVIDIK